MTGKGVKEKVAAIVPSAGKGTRFRGSGRKIFAHLRRRPLIFYALEALERSPSIDFIVLVTDKSSMAEAKRLVKRYKISKVRDLVKGGRTRSDSVRNGLRAAGDEADLILIHDGVRPFLSEETIRRTIRAAKRHGASISAVPVKSTVKVTSSGMFIKYTPDRKGLWKAQTPQVFRKKLLDKAQKKAGGRIAFTDEAALIENIGERVKIIKGDYMNIKITTAEDMAIAEAFFDRF